MTRIGILTSGGDCPGINALISAVVRHGEREHGDEFVGFVDGWRGVLDLDSIVLDWRSVRGISQTGGTILGISRLQPAGVHGGVDRVREALRVLAIDALVVIGGNGTLSTAAALQEHAIPIVAVPKSVENDVVATDGSLGFDTAVAAAVDAIDRLRATGEAHHRCTIAEVVGTRTGWVAMHAGAATNAHLVLLPEFPRSIDEIAASLQRPLRRGRSPLVIVAEGFRLAGSDGAATVVAPGSGIGTVLAAAIERVAGVEARATALGALQRGATPSAADRVLAARLGRAAVDALHDDGWGSMIVPRGRDIVRMPLAAVVGSHRPVPDEHYRAAAVG